MTSSSHQSHRDDSTIILESTPTSSQLELPIEQPLSHEIFRAEDFEPDQFLLSRRHTALDDLRTELRTYLTGLRSELVGLINEDYEDFIGLGMGLRGTVERAMGKMKAPVEEVKMSIENAKEVLQTERSGLEALLHQRRDVIEGKRWVRLMLDCGEAVSKVEDMLSINPPSSDPSICTTTHLSNHSSHRPRLSLHRFPSTTHDELQTIESSQTKRIERIVSEYNQMLYLVSKGSDLAYVKGLKPRISHITQILQRELESLLKTILSISPRSDPRKKDSLLECLRAYESLGSVSEAEQVIKQTLVLPGLTKLIHHNSLSPGAMSPVLPRSPDRGRSFQPILPPTSPSASPSSRLTSITSNLPPFTALPVPEEVDLAPLALMYNKILAFITRELSLVLDLADRQLACSRQSTSSSYNLLIHAVISPLLEQITTVLGPSGLFASGNPSIFHRNFTTTSLFLNQLEGLCHSPRQVLSLRANPDWIAFRSRWQLAVYAQIRTKETISRVEEGLQDGKAEGTRYSLRATETIDQVISYLWREDVFLPDLTHRFWRLTLMTLSRYSTWIDAATAAYTNQTSSSSLTAPNQSTSTTRNSSDMNRLSPARTPSPRSEEMSEEETIREVGRMLTDVDRLKVNVRQRFRELMAPRLPKLSIGPHAISPEEIVGGILEKIERIIPSLISYTVTILVKRCSEKLRLIRSIGSSARSARQRPTQPSFFIPDLFHELRQFLNRSTKKRTKEREGEGEEEEGKNWLNEEIKNRLIGEVIEEISLKFLNILINVQRSEDSLKKLKKGRQVGLMRSSIFGSHQHQNKTKKEEEEREEEEEEERVKIQMRLDVQRLRDDAMELGFKVEESKSMIELLKSVEIG